MKRKLLNIISLICLLLPVAETPVMKSSLDEPAEAGTLPKRKFVKHKDRPGLPERTEVIEEDNTGVGSGSDFSTLFRAVKSRTPDINPIPMSKEVFPGGMDVKQIAESRDMDILSGKVPAVDILSGKVTRKEGGDLPAYSGKLPLRSVLSKGEIPAHGTAGAAFSSYLGGALLAGGLGAGLIGSEGNAPSTLSTPEPVFYQMTVLFVLGALGIWRMRVKKAT